MWINQSFTIETTFDFPIHFTRMFSPLIFPVSLLFTYVSYECVSLIRIFYGLTKGRGNFDNRTPNQNNPLISKLCNAFRY